MTTEDVELLLPGDSVIGLNNRWHDEHVISWVGAMRFRPDGRPYRRVCIRVGRRDEQGLVEAADRTIRGALPDELRAARFAREATERRRSR